MAKKTHAKENRIHEHLGTPTDLKPAATRDVSAGLTALLADVFALYIKTKNFHWHMSGPHYRDYHLLLDEQADQIFAISDAIAERARKIGGTTIRSIGDINRQKRILDNDADYVEANDMLSELCEDNKQLTSEMRQLHETCAKHDDVATTSLLEVWIDEAERRTWFLFESTRR
jgi:starvation-inducible DNA-binding protein